MKMNVLILPSHAMPMRIATTQLALTHADVKWALLEMVILLVPVSPSVQKGFKIVLSV